MTGFKELRLELWVVDWLLVVLLWLLAANGSTVVELCLRFRADEEVGWSFVKCKVGCEIKVLCGILPGAWTTKIIWMVTRGQKLQKILKF